jgi:hypothetical protein
LTCGHFKKANQWLRERYGDDGVIDWNLGGSNSTAALQAQLAVGQGALSAAEKQTLTATETKIAIAAEGTPENVADTLPVVDDSDEDDIEALEALVAAESTLADKTTDKNWLQ